MEELLREVLALDPIFPDGKRPYVEQVHWYDRISDWARGQKLDEGRQALRAVLAELRDSNTTDE